jgi:hypothetical protein
MHLSCDELAIFSGLYENREALAVSRGVKRRSRQPATDRVILNPLVEAAETPHTAPAATRNRDASLRKIEDALNPRGVATARGETTSPFPSARPGPQRSASGWKSHLGNVVGPAAGTRLCRATGRFRGRRGERFAMSLHTRDAIELCRGRCTARRNAWAV